MSAAARREARAARAPLPPADPPAPTGEEGGPKKVHPFAQWWANWNAGRPDWTYEGFERACEKWLAFCGTKHCHSPMEMMEFIAHKVATELNQKKVECKWIMTDKIDGRPYVKITMADRWVYYHDVAVTIPAAPTTH